MDWEEENRTKITWIKKDDEERIERFTRVRLFT
jgi:hypothetical protein